jgi:hypothetical protein
VDLHDQKLVLSEAKEVWGSGFALKSDPGPSLLAFIHRSAWNRYSANFAFWGFCEVRIHGVLGSSHTRSSKKFA